MTKTEILRDLLVINEAVDKVIDITSELSGSSFAGDGIAWKLFKIKDLIRKVTLDGENDDRSGEEVYKILEIRAGIDEKVKMLDEL